jgi:hypothetical protein
VQTHSMHLSGMACLGVIQLLLISQVRLLHMQMTEEEAQERAMVDVMIAAMHEEEYREFGFPLPDNEPNPNAVEVRFPVHPCNYKLCASLTHL